ncbi:unnamed protein product [Ixodes pacificus]
MRATGSLPKCRYPEAYNRRLQTPSEPSGCLTWASRRHLGLRLLPPPHRAAAPRDCCRTRLDGSLPLRHLCQRGAAATERE